MPSRMAGKSGVILVVLLGLGIAAGLGFEFYAPVVGQIAAGDPQKARPDVPRDRAIVKVEAYMSPTKTLPSFVDVVHFYGLEDDTIPCTVQTNLGEAASTAAIPALSRGPLRVGDEVTLCFD